MSEMTTAEPTGSDQPAPVVPEGYVPQGEVEKAREEARRRYQGDLDKAKAELDRLKAASAPKPTAKEETSMGFDPEAFRQQLISEVFGANMLQAAANELKAEYRYADPSFFTPERLSTFGNVDALRSAVEADHLRVAEVLARELEARSTEQREQLAAGAAGVPGPTGAGQSPGGDPTPEQIATMTLTELDALEAQNPGVIERVLSRAA